MSNSFLAHILRTTIRQRHKQRGVYRQGGEGVFGLGCEAIGGLPLSLALVALAITLCACIQTAGRAVA